MEKRFVDRFVIVDPSEIRLDSVKNVMKTVMFAKVLVTYFQKTIVQCVKVKQLKK